MDGQRNEDMATLKFEQAGRGFIFISSVLIGIAICLAIGFTAINASASKVVEVIVGEQFRKEGNKIDLIATLPRLRQEHLAFVLLLSFNAPSNAEFNINADVSCRTEETGRRLYLQTNSTGSAGLYRLFATDYFAHGHVTAQVEIGGDISSITNLCLKMVHASPSFGESTLQIRHVLAIALVVVVLFYILALIMFVGRLARFEHIGSLVSLILVMLSDIPLGTENIYVHSADNLVKGAASAVNLILLFCLVYKSTGGENMSVVLIVASLYVLAEALAVLTDDSCFIAQYFYGNNVVWMFFLTASIVSKIGLSLYLVQGIFISLANHRRKRRRALLLGYAGLIFIYIVDMAVQGIVFSVQYCAHPALTFFDRYLLQTIIALSFADFHWPMTPMSPVALPKFNDDIETETEGDYLNLGLDEVSAEPTGDTSAVLSESD